MKANRQKRQQRQKPKGKKLYSLREIYGISVSAFRSLRDLKQGRRSGLMSEQLQERIMLAVTGVNQCALCSYAHAEMALKAGLNNDEIKSFVSGEFPDIPDDEVKAVLFAQHYAENRGRPSAEAWNEILSAYGEEKAKAILASARMIMLGNAIGIIFGSIQSRFKTGKGDERSNVLYEALFVLMLFPMLLVTALQAWVLNRLRRPVLTIKPPKEPRQKT